VPRRSVASWFTPAEGSTWRLHDPRGKAESVQVKGPLQVNNPDAVRDALVAGLGIGLVPVFATAPTSLGRGPLERVLPRWEAAPAQLSLVYPSSRYLSPKVRAFVDFMVAHFKRPGWATESR